MEEDVFIVSSPSFCASSEGAGCEAVSFVSFLGAFLSLHSRMTVSAALKPPSTWLFRREELSSTMIPSSLPLSCRILSFANGSYCRFPCSFTTGAIEYLRLAGSRPVLAKAAALLASVARRSSLALASRFSARFSAITARDRRPGRLG